MSSTGPPRDVVLVVSDSYAEVTLVQSMLETDFESVMISTDLAVAPHTFREVKASVLVLAFRELRKAEGFYLDLRRREQKRTNGAHAHRAIVLCSKEDVREAYELCRNGLMDEYVQFWPMTFDAPRLSISVHRALQECGGQLSSAKAAAAIAEQELEVRRSEEELAHFLKAGSANADTMRSTLARAEGQIEGAINGLSAQIRDAAMGRNITAPVLEALALMVAQYNRQSVIPHVREVGEAVAPMMDWMGRVDDVVDSLKVSTQAFMELAARSRPCILIVDDDEFQRQMSGQILESAGYQLRFAGGGDAALRALRMERPDLVLMDLLMPDMNGHEVIALMKADAALASIPVIMVTGKGERNVVLDSQKIGAADFVVKPVDRQTLLDKVARLLGPPTDAMR